MEKHTSHRVLDTQGVTIKEGDILKYDEGNGYSQQINIVIEKDGVLGSIHHYFLDCNEFATEEEKQDFTPLQFNRLLPYLEDEKCRDTTVIGNTETDYGNILDDEEYLISIFI